MGVYLHIPTVFHLWDEWVDHQNIGWLHLEYAAYATCSDDDSRRVDYSCTARNKSTGTVLCHSIAWSRRGALAITLLFLLSEYFFMCPRHTAQCWSMSHECNEHDERREDYPFVRIREGGPLSLESLRDCYVAL